MSRHGCRLLRWGASTLAELAAADDTAQPDISNTDTTEEDQPLLGSQEQQAVSPRHGIARGASNVAAQMQSVGRAAAKNAGR